MTISFGPFIVDLDTRQLTRGSQVIHLSPKAFELLVVLAEARPRVLSKSELQQHLWPTTFVAEANLSNLIAEIREALDDRSRKPMYIRTAHRFGYAFCAEVNNATARKAQDDSPVGWLEWGGQHFPLAIGEHVIGRDADVEVRLDASTVSRRHARIVVKTDSIILEDFGSKNGTFRGNERVTTPVRLVDGDAIRIGSLLVTFHTRRAFATTDTAIEELS